MGQGSGECEQEMCPWTDPTDNSTTTTLQDASLAQSVTVAILAQGTSWAVAVTQAFFWPSLCHSVSLSLWGGDLGGAGQTSRGGFGQQTKPRKTLAP